MSDLNEQHVAQLKGLGAQLEATKQMLNDSLMNQLNFRAALIAVQQSHNESLTEISTLKADKEKLVAELAALKAATEKPVFDPAALESKVSPLPSPIKTESKDAVNKIC